MSAIFGGGYDPRGQDRDQDFGAPIPRGEYSFKVDKVEDRKNNDNDGRHLYVELSVIDAGPYRGRKVFDRFNLRNPSEKAESIGRKRFNSFLDAVGMGDVIITNPQQLLGKTFRGRVDIEPGSKGEQNVVKGYQPVGAASQAPAPAPAAAAPAWQRSVPGGAQGNVAQQAAAQTAQPHAAPAASTTAPTSAPSDHQSAAGAGQQGQQQAQQPAGIPRRPWEVARG